jgi:hypothetical protein
VNAPASLNGSCCHAIICQHPLGPDAEQRVRQETPIHRDITPANIVVAPQFTHHAEIVETLAYLALEQTDVPVGRWISARTYMRWAPICAAIILHFLEKPDRRHQTAGALSYDLERVAGRAS